MKVNGTNNNVFVTVNGVKHGNAVSIEFENWAEVNDWWCANPTAIRQFPNHEGQEMTIEEHNSWNHNLTFPCKMTFLFPVNEAA